MTLGAVALALVALLVWRNLQQFRGPGYAFYEGNDGSQDQLCGVGLAPQRVAMRNTGCPNDEARSMVLLDVPAGSVLRVYDSPEGKTEDDWTEVVTKVDVDRLVVGTFERSYEDASVRVTSHRNNGLDGKVSLVEVGGVPSGPRVVLHEGNGGTQNKVCELPVTPGATTVFQGHPQCDNDEARSLTLLDVPAGLQLKLFDNPDGEEQDDWVEIRSKAAIVSETVDTLERSAETAGLSIVYHRNNGLDGKVSRLEIHEAQSNSARVGLYEGNGQQQNLVCELADRDSGVQKFGGDCDNDEARSAALYNLPAGRVVRLYDDAEGSRQDDWVELVVLRAAARINVDSFERSYESPDVRVTFHRNNGLDGKVSRIEFDSAPSGPTVDLYEGNDGSQNLVCSLSATTLRTLTLPSAGCDNDEARSMVLRDLPAGRVIRVFDSPEGNRDDDWTEIVVKTAAAAYTIPTFERSYEDGTVRVHYRRQNGLDGKVSRLELSDAPSPPSILLFEGNDGQQNRVCEVALSGARTLRFPSGGCDNDEVRSAVLLGAPVGTVVRLFDSPDGRREDDWAELRVVAPTPTFTVASFERPLTSGPVQLSYFRNDGLDGKVSSLQVGGDGAVQGVLSFYEGNDGRQNKVCDLASAHGQVKFKGHRECDNDEARSLVLQNVRAGTVVRVFDDPSCKRSDDWSEVRVRQDVARYVVASFERNVADAQTTVAFHRDNGLDGKVSCIQVD